MNVVGPYEAATMSMRKGIPNRLGCFLTTWFIELRCSGREEKCVIFKEWTRSSAGYADQSMSSFKVTMIVTNLYLLSKRNLKEDIDWSERYELEKGGFEV